MALFDTIRAGSSGASEYEVERSLRFNSADSAHLSRTLSSEGNKRLWTWSGWLKLGKPPDSQRFIFSQRTSSSNQCNIQYSGDGRFRFESGGGKGNAFTQGFFRDPSAWYHLIVTLDSDNSTADDRIIIYVNGERQGLDISPTISTGDHGINNNNEQVLGREADTNSLEYDGYMAEIHFIDGARKAPSDFAETDTLTGEYKPIKYEGTYGSQGWYYNFSDNSNNTASTLGKDYSGNGHNTTPGNISVSSGIGNDSVTDSPTNNFCTYNPLNQTNSVSLTEGNLKFSQSSNDQAVTGTMAITSGKWYYEFLKVSGDNPEVGIIATDSTNPDTNGGRVAFTGQSSGDVTGLKIALITNNGQQRNGIDYGDSGAITLTGGSAQTGAGYIGIAIDMDNSKIWYTDLSGNFFNSGDPANGTNAAYDFSSTQAANGAVPVVYFATNSGDTGSVNFGQQPFNHTQPSGFNSLCTQNLADPTIKLSNKYFETLLYTGNGGTQTITGLSFSPDFVWIRERNSPNAHKLYNTISGVHEVLETSGTEAEGTDTNGLTAFNSDGFSVGSSISNNGSGDSYVSWNWDAGDSTVTNNNGTISSQVRANTTAGFSIATWTSDGQGSPTSFGHGLGVKPDFLIIKSRGGDGNWQCWFSTFTNATNNFVSLNLATRVQTAGAAMWGTIDSSVINFRHSANSSNGEAMIGYFFSNVEGFSKAGKYGGNGNSDGVYVHLGFRPAFLMIKTGEQDGDWIMIDNKRDVDNPTQHRLDADLIDTETSNDVYHDFLANGFKLRTGSASRNPSNQEMFYLAFAENPFKYARAR